MAGYIYSLEQLRSLAPEYLKDASDERLIIEYGNDIGVDPFEVAQNFGVRTGQDRTAFGAGVSAGIDSVQGIGINAVAGAADLVGADETAANLRESAEDQNYQAYLSGRPELERIEDQTLSSFPSYFAYQLGRQAPVVGTVVGAQFVPGLGQAATATGLARAGAMAPRMLGGAGLRTGADFATRRAALSQGEALAKSTMVGSGLGFGSLYESSAADGDPDPWKALALAPLYGAAEAAVPAALTGMARLKAGGYTGKLPTRALKGTAVAGTTEAATELAQTELELSLDPTLTSEQRQSARLNAAVAGGLVGGTLGAATGLRASAEIERQRVLRENEVGELDMAGSDAPVTQATTATTEPTDLSAVEETATPAPAETSTVEEVPTAVETQVEELVEPEDVAPVAGAKQGSILTPAKKRDLTAQLEAKQARLARIANFKSRAKTPKAREAAEKDKAAEADRLRNEINSIEQSLGGSDAAVDQRVAEQQAVEQQGVVQEPAEIVTSPSELEKSAKPATPQVSDTTLQAQEALAQETESEGTVLVDAKEARRIASNVDKLNSQVQGTQGSAEGRVTLPKGVLTGITAMLRSSNSRPAVRAYKDGTADIDLEYMDQYGDQMRQIHESAMRLAQFYQAQSNRAGQVYRGEKDAKVKRSETPMDVAENYEDLREKARNYMGEFVSAAGGVKNAEAIIASLKVRNEKNRKSGRLDRNRYKRKSEMLAKTGKPITTQRAYENTLDVLLSSALKEFKDGTLGTPPGPDGQATAPELDVVRGSPTRGSFAEQDLGVEAPLVTADALGGISSILEKVASFRGTTSAYAKTFGQELKKVFDEFENKEGIEIQVEFLEDNGQTNPNYDPSTRTISIHREASQEEILHEALHAATQLYVYQNPNEPVVVALKDSLQTLMDFVENGGVDTVNMPEQHKSRALEVVNVLRGLRDTGNELDAVLELVAYGTTMRDFRLLLKEIKEDPSEATQSWLDTIKGAYNAVIEVIGKLLGVNNTVANNVVNNSMALLEKARGEGIQDANTYFGGNRLEMSVLSNNDSGPVDMDGRPTGEIYRRAAERGQRNNILSTQILFDVTGLTKLWGAGVKKVDAKLSDYAERIRKEVPELERALSYFNSQFSLPPALKGVFSNKKTQRNSGYQLMQRLADFVESQPREKAIALIEYMDGDTTALNKFPNSTNLRDEADSVLEFIEMYVDNLPEELQKEYRDRKFSEYLVYVTDENTVATQSSGIPQLASQIRSQGIKVDKVDFDTNIDLVDSDLNGDPDFDGDFYRVIVNQGAGQRSYVLMASKSLYERLDGQLPIVNGYYNVDTTQEYSFIRVDGKDYAFKPKLNYRQALDAQKAKDLANAMRNTMGGLANYYSSKNFFNSLAEVGKESGVVYDSVDELNAAGLLGPTQRVLLAANADNEQTSSEARKTGRWVQLPDNPDSYGEMAGKIMHGPVYFAMRDMDDRKPLANSAAYNRALRYFKKSKTIYNPGTQITNAASNITLAMMHDIPMRTIAEAAELFYKYELRSDSLTPEQRQVMREFLRSGALLGNYSSVEVRNVMFKSMAKHLRPPEDTVMTRVTGFLNVETEKGKLAERLVRQGKRADDVATQLYAAGDNIFRLAAFIKTAGDMASKENLKVPNQRMFEEAGNFARYAFLDYDIDAPAAKFLRQSLMPFVSWTYAIIPVVGKIAATQPWKVANIFAAFSLLDAATSALAGDDDELRKLGPKQLDERMFGIGPRMHIRIPFLGDDQNPVYYRFGDYVPLASTTRGLPNGFMGLDWFPGGITPTGPIINAAIATVGGVDPYTGKSIHRPTDSDFEKLLNIGKYGYDLFLPPAISSRTLSTFNDVVQGNVNMYSGREPGISNLIFARFGGLKFVDFNVNEQAGFRRSEASKVMRDYKAAIKRAQRAEVAKGYPDYEALHEEIKDLYEEMYEEYDKIYKIED